MSTAVVVVGVAVFVLGALGLVRPTALMRLVDGPWRSRAGLYLAMAVRAALGILLLVAADDTRFPWAMRILGAVSLVAAVSLPIIGYARLRAFVDWWLARPAGFVRGWSAVACLFGAFLVYAAAAPMASAQLSPFDGAPGDAYYYIDHYEVAIDRPLADVWPILVDLGAWMPGLTEANGVSPQAVDGTDFRLYGDFRMKVAEVIPEQLIVLVNLPASQEGEDTQGIVMVSVRETGGQTVVSLFMSRVFFWFDRAPNPLRARRESTGFSEERRSGYIDILSTLKDIAERR